MSYQIIADDFPILDVRDDELTVTDPRLKLAVNTVGSGSFTIYDTHPYYDKLKKLRTIFEVSDEYGVIFRGRMTNDTVEFNNEKAVDLEGVAAFFNDSVIRPFNFPEDFEGNEAYTIAAESGNVVEFLLAWFIEQHNSQVEDFQKMKLGVVTVADPNNFITRSESKIVSTWEAIKSKLFESALGGYLLVRYEEDGNYIDYLQDFTLTNTQKVVYGENLLDITNETDATALYSAIIPLGAEIETGSGENSKKETLTIESIADGDITSDIVKKGDTLYSKSAVAEYGWRCAPVSETTWEDVTEARNLVSKGTEWLASKGMMFSHTIELTAVDLHFSDAEIRSFRVGRYTEVYSAPHKLETTYPLSELDIELMNPQNTKITLGNTRLTLTDINGQQQANTSNRIESAEKNIEETRTEITVVKNQALTQQTEIFNTCNQIIMAALESYVTTSNFEALKETIETQLKIMAGTVELNFESSIEQVNNVNGDLQKFLQTFSKFIRFTGETALTIGSGDSAVTLEVDNDTGIIFKRNGVQFGSWDGEYFYTGNIVIRANERLQLDTFAFTPRNNKSLSFGKIKAIIRANLLSYSKFANAQQISKNSVSGFGFISLGNNTSLEVFGQINNLSLKTNTNYTLSFVSWVETSDNSFKQKYTYDLWPDTLPQDFQYEITNKPQKYTWTFQSAHSDMTACNMRFFTYEPDSEGYYSKYPIYITDIKLEEGSDATEWVAAP